MNAPETASKTARIRMSGTSMAVYITDLAEIIGADVGDIVEVIIRKI